MEAQATAKWVTRPCERPLQDLGHGGESRPSVDFANSDPYWQLALHWRRPVWYTITFSCARSPQNLEGSVSEVPMNRPFFINFFSAPPWIVEKGGVMCSVHVSRCEVLSLHLQLGGAFATRSRCTNHGFILKSSFHFKMSPARFCFKTRQMSLTPGVCCSYFIFVWVQLEFHGLIEL